MRAHRLGLAILLAVLVALSAAAVGYGLGRADKEPVKRFALARSTHPRGAPGRSLALSRVVIKPGAKLALHHHQGTQISFTRNGTLSYHVQQGRVKVREAAYDDGAQVVREIKAGQTGKVRAGQWLIEQPTDFHRAANKGDERIVSYLATLLKTGAPPSAPVG